MVGEPSLDSQSRRSLRTIESRSVDGTTTSTVTSSNMVRMKGLVKGTPSRFEGSHRVLVHGVVVELPSATGPETNGTEEDAGSQQARYRSLRGYHAGTRQREEMVRLR